MSVLLQWSVLLGRVLGQVVQFLQAHWVVRVAKLQVWVALMEEQERVLLQVWPLEPTIVQRQGVCPLILLLLLAVVFDHQSQEFRQSFLVWSQWSPWERPKHPQPYLRLQLQSQFPVLLPLWAKRILQRVRLLGKCRLSLDLAGDEEHQRDDDRLLLLPGLVLEDCLLPVSSSGDRGRLVPVPVLDDCPLVSCPFCVLQLPIVQHDPRRFVRQRVRHHRELLRGLI